MMKAIATGGMCVALLWSGAALATTTSLNNCQNAVKIATATFIKNKVAAVGT